MRYDYVPDVNTKMLRWLISMRYKIALAFLIVLMVSTQVYAEPLQSVLNMVLVVGCYLLTNVLYSLFLHINPSPRRIEIIRQVQLPIELVIATAAIYYLGGVLTPMFIIYMVSILISIILLDAVGVYRTAGLAAILYSALAMMENYRLLPYVKGYWGDHDYYETASPATYALYVLAVTFMLLLVAFIASRVALVIGQRNRQIENQLENLHTLYDIANGLGSMTDEAEMLRYLANRLKNLQDASLCMAGLINKDGLLELKASAGLAPDLLQKLNSLDTNRPELAGLFQRGEPIIIEDLDKQLDYKALSVIPTTRSVYVFPLKSDAEVLGAISLSFDRLKPLSPEYNELLSTIAAQAGVALQRARLFTDSQRMALEMSTLYDFGLHTGSTLSPHEVLKRTAANIEKLMNPDTYYIAQYDAATQTLIFDLFVESGQLMPKMRMSVNGGGLTAQIVTTRRPLLVQDWLADGAPYNTVAKRIGADMLSYLGVPMLAEDRVIGVISVQSARPMAFTLHDERLLSALAAQTAMAFENAQLHQQVQEQAKLDSLTQIYNQGYFVELAQLASAAADMNTHPVSLIMMDIDHFKAYNDTYGHVAGDNVLRLVADVLRSNTKSTDATGRWGGEEFALLLPGAGLAEAQKVAKRIQKAIAKLHPTDGQGNLIPTPTISQGISSYPYPSTSLNQLIEHADAALYYAKEHGRNQLTICDTFDTMKTVLQTSSLHASEV